MQRCLHCSAPYQDEAEVCAFCGTLTEQGRRLKAERAQAQTAAAHRDEAERRDAQRRAELLAAANKGRAIQEARRAGSHSLLWTLVGLWVCCLPVGPLIGIVVARRARQLSLQAGIDTVTPTLGMVLGIAGVAMSLLAWGGVAMVAKNEADRKAELKAIIAKGDADVSLGLTTACALAELEVINSKYQGYSAFNDELSCGAQLEQDGAEARLADAHFTHEDRRVRVVACFKRADRWVVSQVRGDDRCDAQPSTTGTQ